MSHIKVAMSYYRTVQSWNAMKLLRNKQKLFDTVAKHDK